MSRDELREQLARLADTAPVASVPPDTFRRGRRATARTRTLAAALVAVGCLAVASPFAGPSVHRQLAADPTSPSDAPGASPGMPDQIWAYTTDTARTDDPITFSVAAVAYTVVSTDAEHDFVSDLVLVSPDGHYARFGFPVHDYGGAYASDDPSVALSPDGTRVAWYYHASSPLETGITVMDLVNGTVKSVRLGRGKGIYVQRVTWSPDSRSLVWYGVPFTSWSTARATYASHQVGGILTAGPASLRVTHTELKGSVNWPTLTPCNGGQVRDSRDPGMRADCSPEMRPTQRAGQLVTPLGWTSDHHVATLQHPAGSWDHSKVIVDGDPVSRINDAGINNLTVATALIGGDHPSHHVDEPEWARPRPNLTAIAGGTAVCLVIASLWWRRRRRTRP